MGEPATCWIVWEADFGGCHLDSVWDTEEAAVASCNGIDGAEYDGDKRWTVRTDYDEITYHIEDQPLLRMGDPVPWR